MSIVLQGSTSGSVTLQEPAVAGTTVLDLPATSGTVLVGGTQNIPKSALPTGSVLQVVNAIKTDTSSTSSTSYSDISGLSVSITPTSSSSKILVMLSIDGSNDSGSLAIQLVRNSTAIAIGTAASGNQLNTTLTNYYNNTDPNSHRSSSITFLDSPATTSSTTYKAQFRTGTSGNGYINRSTGTDNLAYNMYAVSTITVMEIAA
jgi:hypothetical protein